MVNSPLGARKIISKLRRFLWNGMVRLIVSLISLFSLSPVFAANAGFTYQGRILAPDGNPLKAQQVEFNVQIVGPLRLTKPCVMYAEKFTLDMSSGDGSFALTIGRGERTDASSVALPQLFSSTLVFPALAQCEDGYVKQAGDAIYLNVTFNEGIAGAQTLPPLEINYSPYSMDTAHVAGVPSEQVLRINNTTQAPSLSQNQYAMNFADFTEFLALLNGTSTQYLKNEGSTSMNLLSNSNISSHVTLRAPSSTFTSYDLTLPDSAGDAGQVLVRDNNGGTTWTTPATSPWVTSGNDISYTSGKVGIGTTNPTGSLDVGGGKFAVLNNGDVTIGKTTARAPIDFFNEDDAAKGTGILAVGGIIQLDGLHDLTTGATVTATGGSLAYPPHQRDEANRWASIPTDAELTIDIGRVLPVKAIAWGTYWKYDPRSVLADYTIDYSTDGTNWSNWITQTNNTKNHVLHVLPTQTQMQYLRIKNNGASGPYVANLQLLGYNHQSPYSGQEWGFLPKDGGTIIARTRGGVSIGTNASAPSGGLLVSGKVGIGTDSPTSKLTVAGTALFNAGGGAPQNLAGDIKIIGQSETAATLSLGYGGTPSISETTVGQINFGHTGLWNNPIGAQISSICQGSNGGYASNDLSFSTRNSGSVNISEIMRITYSGKVGIGTTTPTAKLEVNGQIKANNIKSFSSTVSWNSVDPEVIYAWTSGDDFSSMTINLSSAISCSGFGATLSVISGFGTCSVSVLHFAARSNGNTATFSCTNPTNTTHELRMVSNLSWLCNPGPPTTYTVRGTATDSR